MMHITHFIVSILYTLHSIPNLDFALNVQIKKPGFLVFS